MIKLDGIAERRKTDIRLYTYDGKILLTAARLYKGRRRIPDAWRRVRARVRDLAPKAGRSLTKSVAGQEPESQ